MQKKILLLTARADIGGGPKHVGDLARGLVNRGYQLTIASPGRGANASRFKELAYQHISLPARTFSLLAFAKLLFLVKYRRIDVVHSHGRGAGIYSRLLRLFGARVIHTFHGVHDENSFYGKLKLLADKLLSPLAQQYVCVSESEKDKAVRLGVGASAKIVVIPNGIDTASIAEEFRAKEKGAERERFALPAGKTLLGTLSRLDRQKGHFDFLHVVKRMDLVGEYHFAIAGGGECESELRAELKKLGLTNVTFLGETDDPIAFLACLDGYFSFSRGEGLPLSVLEAMACSLPVLLSDVAGHRDLSGGACLFDPSDPEAFALALHEITTSASTYAQKARDKVERDHSLSQMLEKTLALY